MPRTSLPRPPTKGAASAPLAPPPGSSAVEGRGRAREGRGRRKGPGFAPLLSIFFFFPSRRQPAHAPPRLPPLASTVDPGGGWGGGRGTVGAAAGRLELGARRAWWGCGERPPLPPRLPSPPVPPTANRAHFIAPHPPEAFPSPTLARPCACTAAARCRRGAPPAGCQLGATPGAGGHHPPPAQPPTRRPLPTARVSVSAGSGQRPPLARPSWCRGRGSTWGGGLQSVGRRGGEGTTRPRRGRAVPSRPVAAPWAPSRSPHRRAARGAPRAAATRVGGGEGEDRVTAGAAACLVRPASSRPGRRPR